MLHRSCCSDHHPPRRLLRVSVRAAVLLLVAAAPGRAEIPFEDFFLPAGRNPQSLSASDCDGNGAPDLIAANFGSDTVTIHLNAGQGVFPTSIALPVVAAPAGADCADFTGDGLFDLAVASFSGGAVTIYRGEETGGFTPAGTFAAGAGARTVSVFDFGGNGVLDLAVVNSQSDDVTLLIGNGAGAFPAGASLNITGVNQSNPPVAGAVADYDLDGTPDFAIVSQGRPALHVLLNGDEVSPNEVPSLPRSRGVAAGDVNGDTVPDLAVLSTDSVVRLLLGGPEGFVLESSIGVHPNARAVALADFDQDGLVDLAVAYNDSNSIQVVRAVAPGRFPTVAPASAGAHNPLGLLAARGTEGTNQLVFLDDASRFLLELDPLPGGGLQPSVLQSVTSAPEGLLAADLNGDSVLDAVAVGRAGREVTLEILPGVASGFAPAATGAGTCGNRILEGAELCDDGDVKKRDGCSPTCRPEIGGGVRAIDAADLTGDDLLDLVVVDERGQILLLVGDGAARFTAVRLLAKVRSKTTAAIADFDGSGSLDVAFLPRRSRDGALAVLFNDGEGAFVQQAMVPAGRLRGPMLAADADGNGAIDVVLTTLARPAGITVVLNDGDGPARLAAVSGVPRGLVSLAGADFTEDGRLDLLAEFKSKKQLPLMVRGIGAGEFAAGVPITGARFAGAMIFDVDDDLHHDLVVCDGGSQAPCRALYGDGTGHFFDDPTAPDDRIGSDLVAFAEANFDGDAVVDLVGVSRDEDRVVVLCRSASGTEVTRVALVAGSRPTAVAVGDLDGDTDPDILVANEGSHDLSRFIKQAGCTFSDRPRIGTGGVKPRDVALLELNGAPPLDAVVALDKLDASGPQVSGVAFFVNQGNALLARAAAFTTGANPQALAVGLLNADAEPDVVTADLADDTLTVLLSAGGGAYTPATVASGGSRPTDVVLADVDGDAIADVVAANEASGNVAVFLNDGTGTLPAPISSFPQGRERPWSLCAGDFDVDGDRDLALASVETSDILLLRGRGDGTWHSDERVYPIGRDPHPVVCSDVDGDGLTDVLFPRRRTGRVDVILSGE